MAININQIYTKYNELKTVNNTDYFNNMSFIKEVIEQYRHVTDIEDRAVYYKYIITYFLKYLRTKYNKPLNYEIASDKDTLACYIPEKNQIYFNITKTIYADPEILIFIIFHEFRHKMQFSMLDANIDDILGIDPATILFLKEQVILKKTNLYQNNHSSFVIENDANLFALNNIKQIISEKNMGILQDTYKEELSNHSLNTLSGMILDEDYEEKQDLPIIYKIDYEFNKWLKGHKITKDSFLSLFYNLNGTPKNIEELNQAKQELLTKFKDIPEVQFDSVSTNDYDARKISTKEHINQIFKMVIKSNPLLTIEEHLNYSESISRCNFVRDMLVEIPNLLDIYETEINDLIIKALRNGNEENIIQMIIEINNPKLTKFFKSYFLVNKGKVPDALLEQLDEQNNAKLST